MPWREQGTGGGRRGGEREEGEERKGEERESKIVRDVETLVCEMKRSREERAS